MAMAPMLLPRHRNSFICSASMRDAKQLVQSGAVISVTPKQAAFMVSKTGYKLLDVRPIWERERCYVTGSHHVPLFVEDEDVSPTTLLKKWIHFGYIGMWMGHKFTTGNEQFLSEAFEVADQNKESKLLLACGEGLRSLLAVEKLYKDGYNNIAWLDGGFGNAKNTDFPQVEGCADLQYASIGGVAHYFLQIILLFQKIKL